MPKHLSLQPLAGSATIPDHFTVSAKPPSPQSSSDSDTFTPTVPTRPVRIKLSELWNPVETLCSRELREKRDGKDGTQYSLGAPFGQGAFGSVFAARALRPDGRRDIVCLKRVEMPQRGPFERSTRFQKSGPETEAKAMLAAETWLGPKNLMYDSAIDKRGVYADDVQEVQYAYIEEVLCHGNLLYAVEQFERRHPECLELMVLSMLEQTAKRLALFHGKGWVHRDLKPDNLLFLSKHEGEDKKTISGEIFVGDYGRGRLATLQDPRLAGLGTPGFFSPQAASGLCRAGDDVWALGVTALELLMAENPFDPTPYVDHPKNAAGNPVEAHDTKLQVSQYKMSLRLLEAYEQWFALETKPQNHRLTDIFAELDARFPRAAKLIMCMIHPEREERPSCENIHALLLDEKRGFGLTDAERTRLSRAWTHIPQDPKIVEQSDTLAEAPERLQHSRTFDDFEIPTGFELGGLRRGAKKGVAANVDGLAEKLAHMDVAEVKAQFERKYAKRVPTRPRRDSDARNANNVTSTKANAALKAGHASKRPGQLNNAERRASVVQLPRPRGTVGA